MVKKEIKFNNFTLVDQRGIPHGTIRINISKTRLINYIDEFKYKYDLKVLNPSDLFLFIEFLKNEGVIYDKITEKILWK